MVTAHPFFLTGVLCWAVHSVVLGYSHSYPSHREFILAVKLGGERATNSSRSYREMSSLVLKKVGEIMQRQHLAGPRSGHRILSVDGETSSGVVLVGVPELSDINRVISSVQSDGEVLWAHPNYIYAGDFMESVGSDPTYGPYVYRQEHLTQISAVDAWERQRGQGGCGGGGHRQWI